jgi:hypothetical protein
LDGGRCVGHDHHKNHYEKQKQQQQKKKLQQQKKKLQVEEAAAGRGSSGSSITCNGCVTFSAKLTVGKSNCEV